jgi:hypothetical protein
MSANDYYNSGKPQEQPQGGYYPPQGEFRRLLRERREVEWALIPLLLCIGPPPGQGGYQPQVSTWA